MRDISCYDFFFGVTSAAAACALSHMAASSAFKDREKDLSDVQQRTLRHLAQADENARKSLHTLADQSAHLDRISQKQDSMLGHVSVAEKQLSIMETFTSLFWRSPPAVKPPAAVEEPEMLVSSPLDEHEAQWVVVAPKEEASSEPKKEYLDEVNQGLGRLHHMALRIGETLDTQNAQLADMHRKADVLTTRTSAATDRINKLLH